MYYFKQFCKTVAKGKILKKTKYNSAKFFKVASEAHSIVFYDIDDLVKDQKRFDLSQPLPFKSCAFEFHGKSSLLADGDSRFSCIIVDEVGPQKFDIFIADTNYKTSVMSLKTFLHDDKDNIAIHKMVSACLIALNENSHGQSASDDFVRIINSQGNKRRRYINKIVHVCSKEKRLFLSKEKELEVDWSHRWEVRGHWRDIVGLGKDRSGDYCITNKTWVIDHVKGPEDLPLIRKTRVINSPVATATLP